MIEEPGFTDRDDALHSEAERLLQSAKSNQSKGDYRIARDEAEQARDKAMAALHEAQAAKAAKPGP